MIDLERKIKDAIKSYCDNKDAMHVPPRDTDIDVVLSDCLKEITELKQKLEKLESGEFVLLSKPSVSSIVLDEDTINLDDEITKLSSDFSEKCFLNGEQEEDIEILIAKSMKLGELYERKRWQQVIIEAEPSI